MERFLSTGPVEVFDTDRRFAQINNLRARLSNKHDIPLSPLNPNIFGAQSDRYAEVPTMGIEIEINWRHVFPELSESWGESRPKDADKDSPEYIAFSEEYNRRDGQLKPVLEDISKVIPHVGKDAYWEFSFLPTKHIGITLAELQTLYEAGILRDGESYATHMTIASIDNERDAFAFICGIEIAGGTTPERIASAYTQGSYDRKGKGGIHIRHPDELIGDDTSGYELRTLVVTSLEQATRFILTASQLGEMYQNDPAAWANYRTHIWSVMESIGVPLKAWDMPRVNINPWVKYAEFLASKKDA